jgi:hypothetical protein
MFDMIDYTFPVETQRIYNRNGDPIEGHKAIVRTDTDEVLGVHGSRYQMVRHDTVVNSIMDAVKASNISMDYDLNVVAIENGRKLRGEILFNDVTIQPQVGDYVKFRVSFFNSYDGSWSFSQAADGLRLWCLNGCTHAMGTGRSKFKHTQSINVEGSAAKIVNGLDTFINQREVWQSWMTQKLSAQTAELFFKRTIAKAPTNQTMVTKTNEKQLENLIKIYSDEAKTLGSNKWALYNAMTFWASHTHDLKNPEVARRNREDAIAKAMSDKLWHNIEAEEYF